jgi:hypothetical protein
MSRALPFLSLFPAPLEASFGARRAIPLSPSPRAVQASFNQETLHAVCLVIDARTPAERDEDQTARALKGPASIFFQGHAQRPEDAYGFTSALARLSRSGIVVVPVCDTPFGSDEAWRGDKGKIAVLMEVARFALVPYGIRVEGCPASPGPILVDGLPVGDGACPVSTGFTALGWSHGGILARRFAHAYPGCVSNLGQVCPAGYEHTSPGKLTGRFAREALRISRITAGTHPMEMFRSALGFTRGFVGDITRSLASAARSHSPARALRAARDVRDCSLYCDSSNFGLKDISRIAVAFGVKDTCMSPRRILGVPDHSGLTADAASGFWQKYYADVPRDRASLYVGILPGTHLAPVTHSDLYARTILGNLGELAPS